MGTSGWHTLVFDEDKGQWMDPQCKEMRIRIRPSFLGVQIPDVIGNAVRSAIPVLDEDGYNIKFGDDRERLLPHHCLVKARSSWATDVGRFFPPGIQEGDQP